MGEFFKPNNQERVDSRRRRRLFRFIRKIERICAVILIWLAVGAVFYGVYTAAFERSYFEVKNIEVEGELHALSREIIIERSGINIGDHLLRLPVSEIQKRLAEVPWIKEVAVHRKLPHMVWIYVNEYQPEAIVRGDDWSYVDRYGVPFKKVGLKDDRDLLIITGLEAFLNAENNEYFKSKVREVLRVKKIYEASQLFDAYGVSEINFDEDMGVSIITMNDPMVLRLGSGPFVEKIERLETVYPAIRSHGGVIAYVDLSSEGKVVVRYGT